MITVLQLQPFLPLIHQALIEDYPEIAKVNPGKMSSLQLLTYVSQDGPYMVQSKQNRAIMNIICSCVF